MGVHPITHKHAGRYPYTNHNHRYPYINRNQMAVLQLKCILLLNRPL